MKQKIKVWDVPTRLFHWVLVLGMFGLYFSAKEGGNWLYWHLRLGVFLGAMVLFRIVWGFVGSDTSRFAQFFKPQDIGRYLNNKLPENEQPGHNPVGALMVVAMLAALLFQVVTGLLSPDENTYIHNGFLSTITTHGSTARTIHLSFFWLIVTMAGVHILAVIYHKLIKKHDLIMPMFTGYKVVDTPLPSLKFVSAKMALLIFVVIAVLLFIFVVR